MHFWLRGPFCAKGLNIAHLGPFQMHNIPHLLTKTVSSPKVPPGATRASLSNYAQKGACFNDYRRGEACKNIQSNGDIRENSQNCTTWPFCCGDRQSSERCAAAHLPSSFPQPVDTDSWGPPPHAKPATERFRSVNCLRERN